jgi:hypothetical protein
MNLTQKQLRSSEFLFKRKQVDEESLAQSDILRVLFQPRRSLFYYREFGAGIQDYENAPNDIMLQVLLRYRIVEAVVYRNRFVTDGSDDTIDRRIATSQNAINFVAGKGNLDIDIQFFLYSKYDLVKKFTASVGG